ncbi:MAG: tetratricopeptide repeat protein [bacterium]|nr:tetratricopeptide repeat protein [bacterium]
MHLAIFLAASLAVGSSAPRAQDESRSIESYRAYLERAPHHERVFEQFVRVATLEGALEGCLDSYRSAHASDPEHLPTRVVYARLLAVTGSPRDALELLERESPPSPETLVLRARLHARLGERGTAAELFARAATESDDLELACGAHRQAADLHFAAGAMDEARDALFALRDTSPGDVDLRLEVAERFARSSLAALAVAEFEAALEVVADAPSERARVLARLSALHEERFEGRRAQERACEALALLGRDHWLAAELRARILRVAARGGRLAELVAEREVYARERRHEPDAHESLAEALELAGDPARALAVLAPVVAARPDDARVGRWRIALARAAGDVDFVVREYQRLCAQRPEDVELAFELGAAFFEVGREEQAVSTWTAALDAQRDSTFALRIAEAWRERGRDGLAETVLERAIGYAPCDVGAYVALARLQHAALRDADARATLERAERALAGRPSECFALAQIHREHGAQQDARRLLLEAMRLAPGDADVRIALAGLLEELGEVEAAEAALRAAVDLIQEAGKRESVLGRLATLAKKSGSDLERRSVLATHGETVHQPGPFLVLAAIELERGDPRQAVFWLEQWLQVWPDDTDVREWAGRLCERGRQSFKAIEHYTLLARAVPARRRAFLDRVVVLQRIEGRTRDARATLAEMRTLVTGDSLGLRTVASHYVALGESKQAIELLREAVRLAPRDAPARMLLGQALGEAHLYADALVQARAAFCMTTGADARAASRLFHELLEGAGLIESERSRLVERMSQNPYDACAPLLLADLLAPEAALDVLDAALARSPRERALLERRIDLLRGQGNYTEVRRDLLALADWSDVDAQRVALELAAASAAIGLEDEAFAWAQASGDALAAARGMMEVGAHPAARRFLVERTANRRVDPELLIALADACAGAGDHELEATTLERYAEQAAPAASLVARLGAAYHARGDTQAALECGRRLIAMQAYPKTVKTYYARIGELGTYAAERYEGIVADPSNRTRIDGAVTELFTEDEGLGSAVALVRRIRQSARRQGAHPADFELAHWLRLLAETELSYLQLTPDACTGRSTRLAAKLRSGGELERHEWIDYAWLAVLDLAQPGTARTRLPTLRGGAGPTADLEAIVAASQRFADAPELLTPATLLLHMAGDFERALASYRRLETLLGESTELRWREVPSVHFPAAGSSATFLPNAARQPLVRRSDRNTFRIVASADEARRGQMLCLLALGRTVEAEAIQARLVPPDSKLAEAHVFLGEAFLITGFEARALTALEAATAIRGAPRSNVRSHHSEVASQDWWSFAWNCADSGRAFEAYRFLRSRGQRPVSEYMLQHNLIAVELGTCYERAFEEAWSRRATPSASPGIEPTYDDLYDLVVQLAEVEKVLRGTDKSRAAFERVSTLTYGRPATLDALAARSEAIDGFEAAVRLHENAIALKREGVAYREDGIGVEPLLKLLEADGDDDERWRRARRPFVLRDPSSGGFNYASLVRLHLELGRPAEALAALTALRETRRGDSRLVTRWMWDAIRGSRYDLGDERARFEELLEPRRR